MKIGLQDIKSDPLKQKILLKNNIQNRILTKTDRQKQQI